MQSPLADRSRPTVIDDIVGQDHLLSKGKALRTIIESKQIPNMIFYGPSGVGKTTLAYIIANSTNKSLHKLNATTASTADIKAIFNDVGSFKAPEGILLYLDEIQYFSKKQQQTLLEFIENGSITLIASTTENPYFYIYNAILSRCTIFEFKDINTSAIRQAILRAVDFLSKERNEKIEISDEVIDYISNNVSGDVRKAINALELCTITSPIQSNIRQISLDTAKELTQRSYIRYDKKGDNQYDLLSAFQKSMRGSDSDAAIHYLARLLEAGDMIYAIRRLLICACEDVGLAYPQIIPIVKSCTDIALQVGLPEARIPLADAVILICNAVKSNSAYLAINEAINDVKNGKSGSIPRQLQNKHCDGEDNPNKGQFYIYPHDFPNHYVKQQYIPNELKNKKYYNYSDNKVEQAFKTYWGKIKK